jgi:ZIP family zinc transporter
MVAEAALWGLIGASALVVGAEVAFAFHLSSKTIGLIMAFGIGALI